MPHDLRRNAWHCPGLVGIRPENTAVLIPEIITGPRSRDPEKRMRHHPGNLLLVIPGVENPQEFKEMLWTLVRERRRNLVAMEQLNTGPRG